MPSGRTHDRITFLCLPWVGGLGLIVTLNWGLTLWLCGGFLFSGLMFGPDLDIYSKQYQRWGPLRFIWIPYRKALSHRSWLSHGPIVGTVLRVLYLGVWAGLGLSLYRILATQWGGGFWDISQLIAAIEANWHQYSHTYLTLLVGFELGAMSHSLSDHIGSGAKAFLKRFRRSKSPKRSRR